MEIVTTAMSNALIVLRRKVVVALLNALRQRSSLLLTRMYIHMIAAQGQRLRDAKRFAWKP